MAFTATANRFKRAYNSVMVKPPLVVANSAFIRDHIMNIYGIADERLIVAPRGVDTEAFNPDKISATEIASVRADLGGADRPLVVIVGRITDWKGHRYLIEALQYCENRDFAVAIVGSGNENVIADLKTLIKNDGLENRVRLTGSRRDIPAIMAAANIAVSASVRPEAFGRVAIEAEVMGTPVIATAHGGSLETIIDGETGFLVPPADPAALAKALDKALADKQALARMGEAARAYVLANFTVDIMLEKEFSAYSAVLDM